MNDKTKGAAVPATEPAVAASKPVVATATPASAVKPEAQPDANHGKGGAYEIKDGKRVLVARTKRPE